jgi:hypothetical protein
MKTGRGNSGRAGPGGPGVDTPVIDGVFAASIVTESEQLFRVKHLQKSITTVG